MRTKRIEPGPGQESVWDYPRPPRLEDTVKRIRVVFNGVVIADTRRAKRVLETSHPPGYYVPPEDILMKHLIRTRKSSHCEWKGVATYYSVVVGERRADNGAWCYPDPTPAFASLRDYVAFYPGMMDECYVDDERARPQPGDFYGGWVTRDITGPFKGGPGSVGW
jgi:uncharacterized protein (DUF427 family)